MKRIFTRQMEAQIVQGAKASRKRLIDEGLIKAESFLFIKDGIQYSVSAYAFCGDLLKKEPDSGGLLVNAKENQS